MTRWQLFRRVVLGAWVACVPMIALAAGLRLQPWWTSGNRPLLLLTEIIVVSVIGLAGIWRFGLDSRERDGLAARLFPRRRRQPC